MISFLFFIKNWNTDKNKNKIDDNCFSNFGFKVIPKTKKFDKISENILTTDAPKNKNENNSDDNDNSGTSNGNGNNDDIHNNVEHDNNSAE